ncbi:MAG: hypothetical protein ACKOJF_32380, partial [Planctomycetaceae bacterium]
ASAARSTQSRDLAQMACGRVVTTLNLGPFVPTRPPVRHDPASPGVAESARPGALAIVAAFDV